MKIGIVLAQSPQYSETFFRSKISGLKEHGHYVVLFCQKTSSDFSLCDVRQLPNTSGSRALILFKIIATYFKLIPYLNTVFKYFTMERKAGVSVFIVLKKIYLNAPFFKEQLDWLHFGFGTLAIGREHIAKTIHSKMAVSFRGFDIGVYPLKSPNCYDEIWSKVDKIHVISDDIIALLYKNKFKDQAPVVKITPAIDINFFTSTERINNNTLQFITVARLHWKKGLDYTLEALALLKQQYVKFHYTIIGDGPEQEYLKFTVYQLGLETHVTFTGKLSHDKIKSLLGKANIYLQYSVQEGFCNAVLEAQAMECLCVVSDAEGLSENVLHEQTGWVVAKRNAPLLSHTLMQVLNLSEIKKEAIREQARKRVEAHFNSEQQKMAFSLFYKIDV